MSEMNDFRHFLCANILNFSLFVNAFSIKNVIEIHNVDVFPNSIKFSVNINMSVCIW